MSTLVRKAAALLLTASLSPRRHHVHSVAVGDEVCITGYIMDNYCLFTTGGVLLDNPDVITLQYPEEHSFHCLLDVDVCYESGFQVLGDKDPATDRHCLGFRLDDIDAVLTAGRALGQNGYCETCDGDEDDDPEYGYRATVKGVVKEMGDGSDGKSGPPILTDIQMLAASVGCDGNPTIPPLCVASTTTVKPMPSPLPTDNPTNQPSPAVLVGATKAPVGPPLNCPDTLEKSTEIDSISTFHFAMVPSDPPGSGNGILCGRIEAENDGWVGLAISGDGSMIGSEAIIGVPGDDNVLKYDLNGKGPGGVTAMSDNKQTLRDTSIVQEGAKTIMVFTKLLVEDGEIPIVEGENIFLHARGGSSLGYHSNGRVIFNIDFGTSVAPTIPPSASPEIAPSTYPTKAPLTLSPSALPTKSPTGSPILQPSTSPQTTPSKIPTKSPSTLNSSLPPTNAPAISLTGPTFSSITSTDAPTKAPTVSPSSLPSASPTEPPATLNPSQAITKSPTCSPTATRITSKAPSALPPSTLAAISNATFYAPSAANLTTTSPSTRYPTKSPDGAPSASPPLSAAPTMTPSVLEEDVPVNSEPPTPSDSGAIRPGLVYLLFVGLGRLALCVSSLE